MKTEQNKTNLLMECSTFVNKPDFTKNEIFILFVCLHSRALRTCPGTTAVCILWLLVLKRIFVIAISVSYNIGNYLPR